MPSIIYIVGFMGCGKSTVGRLLAEQLGWSFIDLDDEIERREGTRIRELFRRKGEPYFRQVEREELVRISSLDRQVVALGGGAFCSADNRSTVRKTGTSVWLDAPIETLIERCAGDELRPLFTSAADMKLLLEQRRPLYEQSALRIEVGNLSPREIATIIRSRIPCDG
jgi:shikimate kinase